MKRFALSLLTLIAAEAHADIVSDRVVLVSGGGGCPAGSVSFRRIKQLPNGTQTAETAEYQVPYGSYLEITSIETTIPYWTTWAKWYVQSVDYNILPRTNAAGTNILSVKYGNHSLYAEDANDNYVTFGEAASPGPETHVASFPVGPLMGSTARLCASVSTNFWNFGGAVRVRGRLLPSGEPPLMPSDGTLAP